jgi:hypothetical protein
LRDAFQFERVDATTPSGARGSGRLSEMPRGGHTRYQSSFYNKIGPKRLLTAGSLVRVRPGEPTKSRGASLRTVQRIWEAHRLQPHRLRTFKKSTDPAFAEKVEDVVGLYMEPPCHAVVLSIDEESQIQALDRTQPGLPLKPGKCATMTHDYKRNRTTTLFAALNVLDGTVPGRCMKKHRHQEFIKFLNAVERKVPAGKIIHVLLDNYGTHKHPRVDRWLADHPRWVFHFTPHPRPG